MGVWSRTRRLGVDERTVKLEPDWCIAPGTADLRSWRVEGDRLILAGDHADTARLSIAGDGCWRSRERWYARVPVEVVPLD